MAAKLPAKYTGAVILGTVIINFYNFMIRSFTQIWQIYCFRFTFQNISGTFTAIISVFAQYMAPNARTAAIYYFITALFILLACFDTYFALPINVRFIIILYIFFGSNLTYVYLCVLMCCISVVILYRGFIDIENYCIRKE